METIIIKVDTKKNASKISGLLHLMKGVKKVKLLPDLEKSDLMSDIEQSLKEVKLIREGKLPLTSIKDILNGK